MFAEEEEEETPFYITTTNFNDRKFHVNSFSLADFPSGEQVANLAGIKAGIN